jgi:hypothetical protein
VEVLKDGMRTVAYINRAEDGTGRKVLLFSDGEYCAWQYFDRSGPGWVPREQMGSRMELPYRVHGLLAQYRPKVVIPGDPKTALVLLSKVLILDYARFAFEIQPEEWCSAA